MKDIKYLPIINRDDSCKLTVSDICYISRDNRKLQFETDDGMYQTYARMDDVEDYLGPDFYRCMSGFIVNLTRIKRLNDQTVYFDNGDTVRLGRDAYIKVKQKFNAYLMHLIPAPEDEK